MGQSDQIMSVITVRVCKVIQKIIIKIDFQYWTDVNKKPPRSICYQKSILSDTV